MFYGTCFAAMAWLVTLAMRHAFELASALTTGFFLVGPFLAIGIYDLSRRRERGERVLLAPTLDAWRANTGAIGVFALVLTVVLLVWARVSLIVFALFYSGGMPTLATFVASSSHRRPTWSSSSRTRAWAASSRCSRSPSA